MSAADLLDRLDAVRETGPDRWLARCPAHDDRSPSLSVCDMDDRVLVHCFGGCDALDIVHAVGLELADLFAGARPTSQNGHRHKPSHRRIPARDILTAIDHEAHVVAVIASDIHDRRDIDAETWARLATAAGRIGAADDAMSTVADRAARDDERLADTQRRLDETAAAKEAADDKPDKTSAATVLVEMAQERYDFGISALGETYALPKSGPKVVTLLRGSKTSLRNELAREYFRANRKAPSQQALTDALLVIEGFAREADEQEMYLRVLRQGGEFWLDVGDPSGLAIRVTSSGWRIEDRAPRLFKRTVLNGSLPEPETGGTLDDLWRLLNVTEADKPLLAAWVVSTLSHDIPHPVLAFFGEQGAGKTTAQKMLVNSIDPGPVPTRKPPRDPESWVTAAAGSWVVGLDNLSDVQPWLSDSICRAVTGDGDVRRKLYTDGEHAVFAFRRCICFNSIHLGAIRGDLAERMLPITLDLIDESERLTEEEIWSQWNEAHPRILGAILTLAAGVARVIPTVELAYMPRMADFARILATVDYVLGTAGLEHYMAKQGALAADSLTDSPFMVELMKRGTFSGTSAELLARLTPEKPPKGWPANAGAVTALLKRNFPALRKLGWTVFDDGAQNKQHAIAWRLTPPAQDDNGRIFPSPASPTRQNRRNGEGARAASAEYVPSHVDQSASGHPAERF